MIVAPTSCCKRELALLVAQNTHHPDGVIVPSTRMLAFGD